MDTQRVGRPGGIHHLVDFCDGRGEFPKVEVRLLGCLRNDAAIVRSSRCGLEEVFEPGDEDVGAGGEGWAVGTPPVAGAHFGEDVEVEGDLVVEFGEAGEEGYGCGEGRGEGSEVDPCF